MNKKPKSSDKKKIREIIEKIRRVANRLKNSGDLTHYKKALALAKKLEKKSSLAEAKKLEQEFLSGLKKKYPVKTKFVAKALSGYEDPTSDTNSPDEIRKTAIEAYNKYTDNCSGSVAYVASNLFGIDDLKGIKANDQVKFMDSHWQPIDSNTAQALANKGEFVVAGLKNPNGDGHVAVVVRGDGATKPDGKFYPNVIGGGGPGGRSDGSKNQTAGDVWPYKPADPQYRGNVKYYIPKKP
jgi:hypothetical protein